jgi:hypothetical protein
LRLRSIDSTSIALASADATLKGLLSDPNSIHANVRLTSIQCLTQRLQYFKGQWQASIETGTSCLKAIRAGGPGRLDEYLDCSYYLAKAKIRLANFPEAQSELELQPLIGPEGSKVRQRHTLTVQIGEFLLSYSQKGSIDPEGLRNVAQQLAVHENETGLITDALDDGLLLLSGCWPTEDRSNSVSIINNIRGEFGARLYQLPADLQPKARTTTCTAI